MVNSTAEPTQPHYSTLDPQSEPRLPAGCVVGGGRFEIVEELGQGGMAIVYRARDRSANGAAVALKVVAARFGGTATEARYKNEARLGAGVVDDPHVVAPLWLGALEGPAGFEGRTFLVTPLVEGESLDERMRRHPTGLEVSTVVPFARNLAAALCSLHARGIVHRDVKPGNLIVSDDPPRARLIDLGLAFATGDGWEPRSPDLTTEGSTPGTPLYMSPQQAQGERPEPAFDIYAFGATLYELLSGNPPWEGLPVGVLLARKCDPNEEPFALSRMRPDLPAPLTDLVDRCLRYDPRQRPSASDCLDVLEDRKPAGRGPALRVVPPSENTVAASASVSMPETTVEPTQVAPPPTDPPPPALPPPAPPVAAEASQRWAIGGAAAIAVALIVAAAVFTLRPSSARPHSQGMDRARAVLQHPTSSAAHRVQLPVLTLGSESDAEPTPTSPQPAPPSGTPKPEAEADEPPRGDPCAAARKKAQRAEAGKRWASVLAHTQDEGCWSKAAALRSRLRVKALQQLGRYKACAREGARSSDPTVKTWGEACFRQSMQ